MLAWHLTCRIKNLYQRTCTKAGGCPIWPRTYGKPHGQAQGICMVTPWPRCLSCRHRPCISRSKDSSTDDFLARRQIPANTTDREALPRNRFNRAMFGPDSQNGRDPDRRPARVPEYNYRAFRMATSGRPGPVVISLAEEHADEVSQWPTHAPYHATHAALSGSISTMPSRLSFRKQNGPYAARRLWLVRRKRRPAIRALPRTNNIPRHHVLPPAGHSSRLTCLRSRPGISAVPPLHPALVHISARRPISLSLSVRVWRD